MIFWAFIYVVTITEGEGGYKKNDTHRGRGNFDIVTSLWGGKIVSVF